MTDCLAETYHGYRPVNRGAFMGRGLGQPVHRHRFGWAISGVIGAVTVAFTFIESMVLSAQESKKLCFDWNNCAEFPSKDSE